MRVKALPLTLTLMMSVKALTLTLMTRVKALTLTLMTRVKANANARVGIVAR